MFTSIINTLLTLVFFPVWSLLREQYESGLKDTELLQNRLEASNALSQASKTYHQKYLERHCSVKILQDLMLETLPLDNIYTTVKFLSSADSKYFFSETDLEASYQDSGERSFSASNRNKRFDSLEVANNEQYLMVLGGPGVGKSTFLRKLGLEALQNRLAHNVAPVFIELKSFKSEEMSLQQTIAKELEISGFPYPENLVESMLSEGKMLILLDGLDEVPSNQMYAVIEQIQDFCGQYSKNRFVISCRSAAHKGGFKCFTNVTIAEFDNDQIEQFVRRWFSSEPDLKNDTAKYFWEILQAPENASAKELAQTPLLLTFLCLVYDQHGSLPAVYSGFYGKVLHILLKDWTTEKLIKREPIYQGFHIDMEKVLLSEIAYQSFKDNQLFFSEKSIVERVTQFLTDTLEAPQHLDGTAILNTIAIQQGILVKRAINAYSFSHLTLQEYLTARHISNKNLIQELTHKHLTDKRWREVFLLVSGLLEEQSYELWLLMEQQTRAFAIEPKLNTLLQWATARSAKLQPNATEMLALKARFLSFAIIIIKPNSNPIINDIVRNIGGPITRSRSIAIDRVIIKYIASARYIVRDIARDISRDVVRDIAKDIKDIESAIVSASSIARSSANDNDSDIDYNTLSKRLESLKEQIPLDKATSNEWLSFAAHLIETFLDIFHLDKNLVVLSSQEAKNLEKYLYATKLIIDCKNAAIRVSRKEWEAIESRLLTPLENTEKD